MAEPEGPLSSPGQLLAAARRARGLELPALAAITRISEQFLAALEADEHDVLPPLYIRSFLRAYAAAVGLPPEEVVASYERRASGIPPVGAGAPVWEQEVTVRKAAASGSRVWLRWVGLALLAAVVVLAAVRVLDRSGRRAFGSGLGPAAGPAGAAADSGAAPTGLPPPADSTATPDSTASAHP